MENKPRIMVVDDEEIVCDMAKRSLEQEGYDVTIFTDSTEALAELQQERYRVLVTDLKMKQVDGLQLLDYVQNNCPDTKVIILTAFGTLESRADALKREAFDYLTKPVRIKDMVATVGRALEAARAAGKDENHD